MRNLFRTFHSNASSSQSSLNRDGDDSQNSTVNLTLSGSPDPVVANSANRSLSSVRDAQLSHSFPSRPYHRSTSHSSPPPSPTSSHSLPTQTSPTPLQFLSDPKSPPLSRSLPGPKSPPSSQSLPVLPPITSLPPPPSFPPKMSRIRTPSSHCAKVWTPPPTSPPNEDLPCPPSGSPKVTPSSSSPRTQPVLSPPASPPPENIPHPPNVPPVPAQLPPAPSIEPLNVSRSPLHRPSTEPLNVSRSPLRRPSTEPLNNSRSSLHLSSPSTLSTSFNSKYSNSLRNCSDDTSFTHAQQQSLNSFVEGKQTIDKYQTYLHVLDTLSRTELTEMLVRANADLEKHLTPFKHRWEMRQMDAQSSEQIEPPVLQLPTTSTSLSSNQTSSQKQQPLEKSPCTHHHHNHPIFPTDIDGTPLDAGRLIDALTDILNDGDTPGTRQTSSSEVSASCTSSGTALSSLCLSSISKDGNTLITRIAKSLAKIELYMDQTLHFPMAARYLPPCYQQTVQTGDLHQDPVIHVKSPLKLSDVSVPIWVLGTAGYVEEERVVYVQIRCLRTGVQGSVPIDSIMPNEGKRVGWNARVLCNVQRSMKEVRLLSE